MRGLVARVIPADQLLEDTLKAAATVASFSLPVVMMIKESINRAFESSLNEGLLFERRVFPFGLCPGTPEARHGRFRRKT